MKTQLVLMSAAEIMLRREIREDFEMRYARSRKARLLGGASVFAMVAHARAQMQISKGTEID